MATRVYEKKELIIVSLYFWIANHQINHSSCQTIHIYMALKGRQSWRKRPSVFVQNLLSSPSFLFSPSLLKLSFHWVCMYSHNDWPRWGLILGWWQNNLYPSCRDMVRVSHTSSQSFEIISSWMSLVLRARVQHSTKWFPWIINTGYS